MKHHEQCHIYTWDNYKRHGNNSGPAEASKRWSSRLINYSYSFILPFINIQLIHLCSCSIKNTYERKVTTVTVCCYVSSLLHKYKYMHILLFVCIVVGRNYSTGGYGYYRIVFTVYTCSWQNYWPASCRVCRTCSAGPAIIVH